MSPIAHRPPHLIQGDEEAFYADKGYDGWSLSAKLAERGIADYIMHPNYRRRPLTPQQKARNGMIAPVRAEVERVFLTATRPCAIAVSSATPCICRCCAWP